jgi:hypothetical protein
VDSQIEEQTQMNAFEDIAQKTIISLEIQKISGEVKKNFIRRIFIILNL